MKDDRLPLPKGYLITMPNGSQYTIKDCFASGGYSLLYHVLPAGDSTISSQHMVIKEYYPRTADDGIPYASRDKDGRLIPSDVEIKKRYFIKHLNHFREEGRVGMLLASKSFQTVSFLQHNDQYALMQNYSKDMRTISEMIKHWKKPISSHRFPDTARVRYALCMVESLLTVLDCMHKCGFLHLDISDKNVLWAGSDEVNGLCGEVFLTDYGEAVQMRNGEYISNDHPATNLFFAAPELAKWEKGVILNPSTDIYSVGMILHLLCTASKQSSKSLMKKNLLNLQIKATPLNQLIRIISTATNNDMTSRYSSARDMLKDVSDLRQKLCSLPYNDLIEAIDYNEDLVKLLSKENNFSTENLNQSLNAYTGDEIRHIVMAFKAIRQESNRVSLNSVGEIHPSVKRFFDNKDNWKEYMLLDEHGRFSTIPGKRPIIDSLIQSILPDYVWNNLLYSNDDDIINAAAKESDWITFDINTINYDRSGTKHLFEKNGFRVEYDYDTASQCYIIKEFKGTNCKFRKIDLDWRDNVTSVLFQCDMCLENCVLANFDSENNGIVLRNLSFDFSMSLKKHTHSVILFRNSRVIGGIYIDNIHIKNSVRTQRISFEDTRISGDMEITNSFLDNIFIDCFQTVFFEYLSAKTYEYTYELTNTSTPKNVIRLENIQMNNDIKLEEIEMLKGEILFSNLSANAVKIRPYYTEVNRAATSAYINVEFNKFNYKSLAIGNVNLRTVTNNKAIINPLVFSEKSIGKEYYHTQKTHNLHIQEVGEKDSSILHNLAERNKPLDLHTPYTYWVIAKLFGNCSFLLFDKENPIGYISCVYNKEYLFIWQIAIDKSYRKKGYSVILIDAAIQRAKELHLNIMVTISADNEISRRAFYGYCRDHDLKIYTSPEIDGDTTYNSDCGEIIYHIDLSSF